MNKLLIAGLIAWASLAAAAAPINGGLVTGTTPTGIYLTNQNGTQYIPYNQASFTLNGQPIEARYVIDGMMTAAQAEFLRGAVRERQNILIAGGTSTGKTTLANSLLAEIAATGDRVLVLEDTIELQCAARDHVPLRTRAGVVSMRELVRATMRLRPDRVVVGEVRGGEALDLIKVWGTGHPGGIATLHAGSALGALLRLEQLVLEVAVNPPRALIAEAVNVVVFIAGRGRKRRIESIARVTSFDEAGYRLADVPGEPLADQLTPFFLSPTTPGELP